jgi:hypothetical protein
LRFRFLQKINEGSGDVRREGGESTNPTLPATILPKERSERKLNLR